MNDPTGNKGDVASRDEVVMTPSQLNEVIVGKLSLLQPEFERLLGEMETLKEDLANGKIHWKDILDRAKLGIGWVACKE